MGTEDSSVRLIEVGLRTSTVMSKPSPIFPVVAPSARTAEENVAALSPLAHVCEVKGAYALVHASPVGVARIAQELGLEVFPSKRGGEYYAVKVQAGSNLTLVRPANTVRPVTSETRPLVLTSPVARPVSKIGTTLTLEFKGQDYQVKETSCKRRIDTRRFEVRKLDGSLAEPYVVTFQDSEGDACQCGCPDWIYRRRQCKHITGIKAAFGKVEVRHAHAG